MYSLWRSSELSFDYCSIYLVFIALAIRDAAATSSDRFDISHGDEQTYFPDTVNSTANEVDQISEEILGEGKFFTDANNTVFLEAVCRDFRYPVKTRLELTISKIGKSDPVTTRFRRSNDEGSATSFRNSFSILKQVENKRESRWVRYNARNTARPGRELEEERSEPIAARIRRDDKTTVTHNQKVSGKDYMSTYYAQRKAIMDKYKSQQKEITERLRKTKSFIAESRKLKESKKIYLEQGNATLDEITHTSPPNIALPSEINSITLPTPTGNTVDFNQTTINLPTEVPIFYSTIFTDTAKNISKGSESFFNSSKDEASDNSTEINSPPTTLSPIYETLRPLADDEIENIDGPDTECLEGTWPRESVNLIPENEVDFNSTDDSSVVKKKRDNDTVLIDLAGYLTDPPTKNDSALNQLEEMFLWDVPAGDETIPRSDKTDTIVRNFDTNSSQSSDSLRFKVEIKSPPEVNVNKEINNVKTSAGTYRNSTYEIVEINGVVNSTKKMGISPDVDLPDLNNFNLTNPGVATPIAATGGKNSIESEWCEECPHDYRWGDCDGTVFYQHNIFLRNRGPSAIDAIFGMNVQGPVYITCVEAIRFNKTRGIVTLHSGGPNYDFAKLRIRGFQGEGFSYIMKVWGVSNEEFIDGTNYPY